MVAAVPVEVFNGSGQLVAAIIDNVPQSGISSIIAAVNTDGEKLIYLPATHDYTIKLTATGDGDMSYAVHEFNPREGRINRMVNFFDLQLIGGQEWTGDVPAYGQAELVDTTAAPSTTVYTLKHNNQSIPHASDLIGDDATNAVYMVRVGVAEDAMGIAFGGGIRRHGTFALVTAVPYEDYAFDGWYDEDGALLSEEEEYRFQVFKDIELTATFTPSLSFMRGDANLD
jgi:hypothetical protein